MTLVTTPGVSDADSYVSATEADAYFVARGVTTWIGTTAQKEVALRRGTSYVENAYSNRWVGSRATRDQALAWPRVDGSWQSGKVDVLYDGDGFPIGSSVVPVQVKNATCEAALLVLTGVDLEPTLTRGNAVKRTKNVVGSITQEIEYQDGATGIDRYTAIERRLVGLVKSLPGASSGTVKLVRA